MIIYFIVFIIVYLIGLLWEKNKNTKFSWIFPVIIAVGVSIFAGLRADTVGTDIKVYAKPILDVIANYGLKTTLEITNVEFLYVILAFIVKLINGNLAVLLFLSQLIPISFYLFFVNKKKEKISISVAVLAYMTILFGISLNIMRQAIAMGIAIFSYSFIKERKLIKFIVTIALASCFHITALIFLPLYFIFGLNNKKEGLVLKFTIIVLLIIFIAFFYDIFSFLLGIGIMPSKFKVFIEQYYNDSIDIQVRALTYKIIMLCTCYYFLSRSNYEDEKEKNFFKFLLIIDLLLYILGARVLNAERLSYFYSYMIYMYIIPKGIVLENNNTLVKVIVNCLLIGYFILTYIVLGFGEIVPYLLTN